MRTNKIDGCLVEADHVLENSKLVVYLHECMELTQLVKYNLPAGLDTPLLTFDAKSMAFLEQLSLPCTKLCLDFSMLLYCVVFTCFHKLAVRILAPVAICSCRRSGSGFAAWWPDPGRALCEESDWLALRSSSNCFIKASFFWTYPDTCHHPPLRGQNGGQSSSCSWTYSRSGTLSWPSSTHQADSSSSWGHLFSQQDHA